MTCIEETVYFGFQERRSHYRTLGGVRSQSTHHCRFATCPQIQKDGYETVTKFPFEYKPTWPMGLRARGGWLMRYNYVQLRGEREPPWLLDEVGRILRVRYDNLPSMTLLEIRHWGWRTSQPLNCHWPKTPYDLRWLATCPDNNERTWSKPYVLRSWVATIPGNRPGAVTALETIINRESQGINW